MDSGGDYVEVGVGVCEKSLIFYSVCCELKSALKIKFILKVEKKIIGQCFSNFSACILPNVTDQNLRTVFDIAWVPQKALLRQRNITLFLY